MSNGPPANRIRRLPVSDQVIGGEPSAELIVDAHRAEPLVVAAPVDQDGRRAALAEAPQLRTDLAIRRDQDAAHPLLLEQIEVAGLTLDVFGAVAEDHREPVPGGFALRSAGEIREERVPDVEHDEPHRRAAPHAQLPRGVVAHIAQHLDRFADPADGIRRDLLAMVQHIRDRADRDSRPLGHIADVRGHRGTNPRVLARATSSGLKTRCCEVVEVSWITSKSRSTTATPKPSWRPRTVLSGMIEASENSVSS